MIPSPSRSRAHLRSPILRTVTTAAVAGTLVHPSASAAQAPSTEGESHVHAGRLLDVESGRYRDDVILHIVGGRVAEVTPADQARPGGEVVDLRSYTVLPGLIDVHTHLADNSHLPEEEFDYWAMPEASFGIAAAVNARTTLHAGFTTVRNVSDAYWSGLAVRDAIEAGWIEGPRVFAAGPMITMTGGHGDWGTWMAPQHRVETPAEAIADGEDEVRRTAREHMRVGVDLLKIAATGGFGTAGSIPGAASYTRTELAAAVDEARKGGITVAAHAHGEEGILNAVAAGVHSIEHGSMITDVSITALKEAGVWLVMDLLAARYDLIEADRDYSDRELGAANEALYADLVERFGEAYRAGVRMAFGTDAGVYPHGRNAEQFRLMVDAGMTPIDAIRSATLHAAELLGIADDAGHLRPGARADLIAVAGDPLADPSVLTDVRFVMKGGVEVSRAR